MKFAGRGGRRHWVVGVAAALGLSCGDSGGGGGARLEGVVLLGTPVAGSTVTATQLRDTGEELFSLGMTTTDASGAWTLDLGEQGFGNIRITAAGGTTLDPASSTVINLDGSAQLEVVVIDLGIGDTRTGVAVTPFSAMASAWGRAYAASHDDLTFNESYLLGYDLLSDHLGFDVLSAPADVSSDAAQPAQSPNEPVRAGLALGALSEFARTIATESSLSPQAMNTQVLTSQLVADVAGNGLFDGSDGAAILEIGACPAPRECAATSATDPLCATVCNLRPATLRAELARALIAFLNDPIQKTTLGYDDLRQVIDHMAANDEPLLFGTVAPEPLDNVGPAISWVEPDEVAYLSEPFDITVTATDLTDVRSLEVAAVGSAIALPPDEDPSPGRYHVTGIDPRQLPEGELVLRATASDVTSAESTSDRTVRIDVADPGSMDGVVVLGPVDGATVNVYEFPDGVKGDLMGTTHTGADGRFLIPQLSEGFSGPVLVEVVGPGSFTEEALPVDADLDVDNALSAVVDYVDGQGEGSVVVTPLTSWALTYARWLYGHPDRAGADFLDVWTEAVEVLQQRFDIPNITTLPPTAFEDMTSVSAATKYTLILTALSQRALEASSNRPAGSGDAGAFGRSVNSITAFEVLDRDLADGCWDGLAAGRPLVFGGTAALSPETTRLELAKALAAYLGGTENQTPFTGLADVLGLLNSLTAGEPVTALSSCGGSGGLSPEPGGDFDQLPPRIDFTGVPSTSPYVRGTITIRVEATDDLDVKPAVVITEPDDLHDADDDTTDRDATVSIDTSGRNGALTVKAVAKDDSNNEGTGTMTFVMDNTAPLIAVSGVSANDTYSDNRFITFAMQDEHSSTMTATLNGAPIASGHPVNQPGDYALAISGADLAGNLAVPVNFTFHIDRGAPRIVVEGITDGEYANHPVTVSFQQEDSNPGTTTATLNGAAFTSGTTVSTQGAYTLSITAIDAGGLEAHSTLSFVIDTTRPVPTWTGVQAGTWYRVAPTITYSQNDTYPAATTATLDGAAIASPHTVSGEAAHTLVVTARDRAGNTDSRTVSFVHDATSPVVSVMGTPPPSHVKDAFTVKVRAIDNLQGIESMTTDIAVTATDRNGATVPVTVTPSTFADGHREVEVSVNTPAVVDGVLTLRFTIPDRAGGVGELVVATVVDRSPPGVTIGGVAPNQWYGANPTITFSQSEANPDTLVATLDGGAITSPHTVTTEGSHSVRVTAQDRAGNVTTRTVAFFVDRTAPSAALSGSELPPYVKGDVSLTVVATDNLDDSGSMATNFVVTAMLANGTTVPFDRQDTVLNGGARQVTLIVHTGAIPAGALSLQFSITDQAGKVGQLALSTTIDNVEPDLTFNLDAFPADTSVPNYRWASEQGPVFRGTVIDSTPVTVDVVVDGPDANDVAELIRATLTGSAWNLDLANGFLKLPTAVNPVTIKAVDAAGNEAEVSATIQIDLNAPTLEVLTTSVRDEQDQDAAGGGREIITWDSDARPTHVHNGTQVALGSATSCDSGPHVYKHPYLLDETLPTGIGESGGAGTGGRNPIAWKFRVTEPNGSGVVPSTVAYQVKAPGGAWPSTWSPAGTQTSVTDGYEFSMSLFRSASATDALHQLDKTEGIYEIRFRGQDRFQREVITTRCWNHHVVAPPLKVDVGHAASSADSNLVSLASLSLATNEDPIAALLNGGFDGAAIMKVKVSNGTTSPAFLTVNPAELVALPKYERDHVTTNVATSVGAINPRFCGCSSSAANCNANNPMPGSSPVNGALVEMTSNSRLNLGVRVFDTTTASSPDEVFPCDECAANEYLVSAGASATAEKVYTVLVTTKSLPDLRPGSGPFSAQTLTHRGGSFKFTGKLGGTFTQCTDADQIADQDTCPGTNNKKVVCVQETTYRTYTALTKAKISLDNRLTVTFGAAAGRALPVSPIQVESHIPNYGWSTNEAALPACLPTASNCPPAP